MAFHAEMVYATYFMRDNNEFMLHLTAQTFNATLTSSHQGSVGSTALDYMDKRSF